ncbi:MAG: hypothetical protein K5694_04545, partial [Bacilli bacterium]|nr:hypothetical protein [Bacilli bacterium]
CNPATPWVTGWEPVAAALFVYVLLVIRHSSNIKRLKAGEEKKVYFSKEAEEKDKARKVAN